VKVPGVTLKTKENWGDGGVAPGILWGGDLKEKGWSAHGVGLRSLRLQERETDTSGGKKEGQIGRMFGGGEERGKKEDEGC